MAHVEELMEGHDLQVSIKRDVIDEMEMFKQFPGHIEKVLEKAGLTKDDIKFVELIGGTSRIPRVSNLVKEFFAPI